MKARILFALALAIGATVGFARDGYSVAAAGSQQCYYTVGVDKETDCTTCSGSCQNGVCCGIVREQ